MRKPSTSDTEILTLIRNRQTSRYGFSLLVQQYQKQLYWHIRRMIVDHEDTNDLVQEVFVKIWKGIADFREDSSLYTWIYRIATNECLSFLQKRQLRTMLPLLDTHRNRAESLADDPYFTGDEIQAKLQAALMKLPPKQRLVFNMRYYEEMPYDEMAAILKTSAGALKASYHIAAKKIEDSLRQD
ncbi:MAG: RNA polymerase sigma factor [Bacteroidales bacterium]|nr:RNA polymerase sigma factor [Lentimicrobiaceae bacterium]MDD5694553.1 RNA polymerase sigma factor [Bacteroidales bacterium]